MFNVEHYLLSGSPIKHKSIGIIYQPKLEYLISENIDYIHLIQPFIVIKKLINKTQNEYLDLIEQFYHISKIEQINDNNSVKFLYEEIITSMKILYRCDDINFVSVGEIKGILIKQEESYLITNDNMDEFLNIIFKMFCIDIDKILEEDKKELSDIEKYILSKREEYKPKLKKKKDAISLMVTYVTHCDGSRYDLYNIWGLTIYQLNHTFETFKKKEKYDVNLKVQLTGMSKENKTEYWIES